MQASSLHDEKQLLLQVAQGDEAAFRKLFHQYWENIYGVALVLTKFSPLAEDMVQDIFLKVWLNKEKLSEVENFSNYLFIIARNHIFDELRKKSRESDFAQQLIDYFNASPHNPEHELLHKESARILKTAIDKLPEQQKKIYQLSRDKGLKHDEIAGQLGISKNTVRRTIWPGRFILSGLIFSKMKRD